MRKVCFHPPTRATSAGKFIYLRAQNITSVSVLYGCVHLYWDLGCSPSAQHVKITPTMNATQLSTKWDPYYGVIGNAQSFPGSMSTCKFSMDWNGRIMPAYRFTFMLNIGLTLRMKSGANF